MYLQKAVRRLEDQNAPIPENCLAPVSPLAWNHIQLTGEYRWNLGR